jgi:hypothetical protein
MKTFKLWHLLALLGLAVAVASCKQRSQPAETQTAKAAASIEHAHEHKAPHNGTLVEFGEEFAHLELVLDHATGRLTAYALDGEAENAVRLKQKEIVMVIDGTSVKFTAVENPLTGEKAGDSSEFQSPLGAMNGKDHFSGVLNDVEIKGQTFKSITFDFPNGNDAHDERK